MTTDLAVYGGLALATTLYALCLHFLQSRQGPNWTWVEVVIGVALCLSAAALRARLQPGMDWHEYEGGVWRSFLVGGAPIIAWQLIEMVWRLKAALDYARERNEQRREQPEAGQALAEGTRGAAGEERETSG